MNEGKTDERMISMGNFRGASFFCSGAANSLGPLFGGAPVGLHGQGVAKLAIARGAHGTRPSHHPALAMFPRRSTQALYARLSQAGGSRGSLVTLHAGRTLHTHAGRSGVPAQTSVALDARGSQRTWKSGESRKAARPSFTLYPGIAHGTSWSGFAGAAGTSSSSWTRGALQPSGQLRQSVSQYRGTDFPEVVFRIFSSWSAGFARQARISGPARQALSSRRSGTSGRAGRSPSSLRSTSSACAALARRSGRSHGAHGAWHAGNDFAGHRGGSNTNTFAWWARGSGRARRTRFAL